MLPFPWVKKNFLLSCKCSFSFSFLVPFTNIFVYFFLLFSNRLKIQGLYLEGARWNRSEAMLDESLPKILFDILPVITMTPTLKSPELLEEEKKKYNCPIYKTTERRGVLATTGHSSNFVMFIQLNTDKSPHHWINRGTASILSLND